MKFRESKSPTKHKNHILFPGFPEISGMTSAFTELLKPEI